MSLLPCCSHAQIELDADFIMQHDVETVLQAAQIAWMELWGVLTLIA